MSGVPDEIRERMARALVHYFDPLDSDTEAEREDMLIDCRHAFDAVLAALDRDALIAMLGACPTDAAGTSSSPESPLPPYYDNFAGRPYAAQPTIP